jgi:hypothetical protein
LLKERVVKIQIIKKAEQKISMHACPWYIDEPPPVKR